MRIKIVRQTVAQKRVVRVGEELDVPESEARLLIAGHKAELVEPSTPAAPEGAKASTAKAPHRKSQAGDPGAKEKS